MKALVLAIIFGILLIGAVSAIDIYDCQTLDIPGETYVLQNDIETDDTCFNIEADGITLDLNEQTITGDRSYNFGVFIRHQDSTLVENGLIQGFDAGVRIEYGDDNIIEDMVLINSGSGASIWQGERNTIINNSLRENLASGVYISYSSESHVINNNFEENTIAIATFLSNYNMINNNYIGNNYVGIQLRESDNNFIYDNLFENVINFRLESHEENSWNISRTRGENIIGGPFLGGNYWANPDGTGFSETCKDKSLDGFCDEPYTLEENNIDYLPLTGFEPINRWGVFVTSFKIFNPNLLETPTADELCQKAADDAGLNGRFVAWLSSREFNASDRIEEGKYYRIDEEKIADSKKDLLDGQLAKRIRVNEFGETMNEGYVYTGARSTGEKWGGRICNGWQGLDENNADEYYGGIGNLMAIDEKWTEFKSRTCDRAFDEGAHLYCFQVGEQALTAEIINPEDNETITEDHVLLEVETNQDAVCEYSLTFGGPGYGWATRPREMEQTGGTFHTQLVEGLEETGYMEHYGFDVTCANQFSQAEDSVTFFVDL